jgi:hypothetical protein
MKKSADGGFYARSRIVGSAFNWGFALRRHCGKTQSMYSANETAILHTAIGW